MEMNNVFLYGRNGKAWRDGPAVGDYHALCWEHAAQSYAPQPSGCAQVGIPKGVILTTACPVCHVLSNGLLVVLQNQLATRGVRVFPTVYRVVALAGICASDRTQGVRSAHVPWWGARTDNGRPMGSPPLSSSSTSQELPGAARTCQEPQGALRSCQELPGAARSCQELQGPASTVTNQ